MSISEQQANEAIRRYRALIQRMRDEPPEPDLTHPASETTMKARWDFCEKYMALIEELASKSEDTDHIPAMEHAQTFAVQQSAVLYGAMMSIEDDDVSAAQVMHDCHRMFVSQAAATLACCIDAERKRRRN